MYSEYAIQLSWVAPYIGAVLALLAGVSGAKRVRDWIAVVFLLLGAIASTYTLSVFLGGQGPVEISYPWVRSLDVNLSIYVDSLSAVMSFVVAWLCFLIGFYSLKYMEGDPGLARYWFFFDFFTGSMLLLILSGDLITMFIGWEGTGLASYALIGFWYTDEEERWVGDPGRKALGIPMYFPPSHSGVRAIVFTRLGDVGLITGIATIYALTGSFSIPLMAERPELWVASLVSKGILLAFLLAFSLGALAKSAQFPFHEWLVTAMTGPTSVSALIHAATMVKAGVYFMLRFVPIFYLASSVVGVAIGVFHEYFSIIALIGGFTAFLMATQALVARELKLVLAFSTASQLGYMFLGAGASGLLREVVEGFYATFSHLISHAIFKAALFLAAGAIIHAIESRYMDDAGGLAKYMKLTYISMLLAALSLSGVPPFMGFWSKDSILEVAHAAGLQLPYVLGVITAALTAFYSIRLIALTFLGKESHNVEHLARRHELHEAHPIMLYPYLLLACASIAIGVLWPLIFKQMFTAMTSFVLGVEEAHVEPALRLDPLMTATSLTMVALGILIATALYVRPGYQDALTRAIKAGGLLSGLRNFLYDRWYINSVYYWIFVRGGGWLSRNLFRWFDTAVIDTFYHKLIPVVTTNLSTGLFRWFETETIDETLHGRLVRTILGASNLVRKVQTGRLNHYLVLFFAGLLIVTLILLWVV